jgi:hypothetical protein
MNNEQFQEQKPIDRGRFIWGVTVFIIGQLTTLLIPFVTASGLSSDMKALLSGILFFVTPQIAIIWAVAILGKQGYEQLRSMVFRWIKRYGAPEVVGPVRHTIGIIMFVTPLLFAWTESYLGHMIPYISEHPMVFAIGGDIMLISSFLVLGGQFCDKFRALFIRKAKAQF